MSAKRKQLDCPYCDETNVTAGHILGHSTSEKKAEAVRRNASMPPKPGSKPRGRPKGKKRAPGKSSG